MNELIERIEKYLNGELDDIYDEDIKKLLDILLITKERIERRGNLSKYSLRNAIVEIISPESDKFWS